MRNEGRQHSSQHWLRACRQRQACVHEGIGGMNSAAANSAYLPWLQPLL